MFNQQLTFILHFDTGASVVSISSVEATFMMKNDYIKPTDIIGKQNYLNANGEISEGTVINLRNVNFGGLNLMIFVQALSTISLRHFYLDNPF